MKFHLILTVVPVIFVALSFAKDSTTTVKKYKSDCAYDQDCGKGMFCADVCECKNSKARIYTEQWDYCTTKANRPCIWHEDKPCVQNASCEYTPGNTNERFCRCNSGFVPSANGTCITSPKFNESCSSTQPCEGRFGMKCNSLADNDVGSCGCIDSQKQIYDHEKAACVYLVGENCTSSDGAKLPCVNNANCGYSKGICECSYGYTASKEGFCLPGFGQSCNALGKSCHENLKCFISSNTARTCRCEHPLQQVYDSMNKTCLFLEGGGVCIRDSDCIPNAECLYRSGRRSCHCKASFISTKNRRCAKSHGQDCSTDNCNLEAGLICKNYKCTCLDSNLIFNPKSRRCEAGKDMPCGNFKISDHGPTKELRIHDTDSNFKWNNEVDLSCAIGLTCDPYERKCIKLNNEMNEDRSLGPQPMY